MSCWAPAPSSPRDRRRPLGRRGRDSWSRRASTARVVDYCRAHELAVYPGVCTPTEIQSALEAGLDVLKFFPAGPLGGASFLKAISAPFPGLKFIPTGGVKREHLPGYLQLDRVLACGGSWLAPAAWIDEGAFDRIRDEAARTAAVVRGDRP